MQAFHFTLLIFLPKGYHEYTSFCYILPERLYANTRKKEIFSFLHTKWWLPCIRFLLIVAW